MATVTPEFKMKCDEYFGQKRAGWWPTKSPAAQIAAARDKWMSTGDNIYKYRRTLAQFAYDQIQAVSTNPLEDCSFLGGFDGLPISYKCNIDTKWNTDEYPPTREGYRALMRELRVRHLHAGRSVIRFHTLVTR